MIQSLRKEKGGYALLYVMVVVMVLCAISMMICTVALRSLQSQEASVRRMQDLYAAEGEIERIKAKIESPDARKSGSGDIDDAKRDFCAATEIDVDSLVDSTSAGEDIYCYNLVVEQEGEIVTVKAKLEIVLGINLVPDIAETTEINEAKYEIISNSVTFTSYTIENTGGGS